MKATTRWLLGLGLWLMWWGGLRSEEFSVATWTAGADRAALVRVDEGTRRVRVLVREGKGGEWRVHGLVHLDGRPGTVKVRLPDGVALADIALEGSRRDPFPHDFYRGRTTFEAVPGGAPGGGRDLGLLAPGAVTNADAEGGEPAGPAAVQESDIWKWRGRTLYYFNALRGLQVFDLSDWAVPRRVAGLRLPAVGEDMYVLGAEHVALLANRPANAWEAESAGGPRSEVVVVRHAGSVLEEAARVPVDGAFMESRMVGDTLCVVTQKTVAEAGPRGEVTHAARQFLYAIDLASPARPAVRGPLDVTPADGAWVWQPVVQATSEFLFLATTTWGVDGGNASWLSVVDLREASRPLAVAARLPVAGQIRTRFQIAESGGIVTTVSEKDGAVIETWNLPQALAGMGAGVPRPLDSLLVGANESLFATRFDGSRVHVVTFRRIDPLFCVDLSTPTDLRLLGELEVPGFSTYLEAFAEGERLLSLGVEDNRVAVSLFDVADPAVPALKSRLHFGDREHWAWSEGNYDDKAIGFFREAGLMIFPLQQWSEAGGYRVGMQLVDATADGLRTRGFVDHRFSARRGRLFDQTLVSIGSQELFVLDVSDRDHPRPVSSLTIAWPVRAVVPHGETLLQLEDGDWTAGAAARAPMLRVTSRSEPDVVVAELPLAKAGSIAGTSLRGDRLYVLLRSVEESQSTDVEGNQVRTWQSVRQTVVVDLAAPEGPRVAGTALSAREGYDWNSGRLEAHWLPDGRLLWYPSQVSGGFHWWWRGGPVAIDGGGMGVVAADVIGMPWRWGGGQPDDLLVVDVTDAAHPQVVAREPAVATSESLTEGRVFLDGPSRLVVSWTGWKSNDTTWSEESRVQEIDLSQSDRPRRGVAATVPGLVSGVHRGDTGGVALFVSRPERELPADQTTTWTRDALVDVLAYDGVQAFLLDTARLAEAGWGATAVSGPHFLALAPAAGTVNRGTLRGVAWNETTGRWAALPDVDLSVRWPSLVIRGGYLFAAEGSMVEVLAAHQLPAIPARVRLDLAAPAWDWSGLTLENATAAAWLPVDAYGVERLDLGGLPAADSLMRRATRDKATAEWEPLALLAIDVVPARGRDGGSAALAPDSDFAFAADGDAETYDAWVTRHFSQAEASAAGVVADPDGDGFDNYAEWAFGTSPVEAHSRPELAVSITAAEAGLPARLLVAVRLNPRAAIDPVPIGSYLELIPEISDGASGWRVPAVDAVEVSDAPGRRLWSFPVSERAPATLVRLRVALVMEG